MLQKTVTVLLAACALTVAQIRMVIWLHDGTQTVWEVSKTDRVQVDSNVLTWQQKSIPVSKVRKITYSPVTAVAEDEKKGGASTPMFGEPLEPISSNPLWRDRIPVEVLTLDGRVVKTFVNQAVAIGELNFKESAFLCGLPAGVYLLRYRLPGQECRLAPVIRGVNNE